MITEFDQSQDFDVGFEEPTETDVAVEQGHEIEVTFENATIIPVELSQSEEFVCEFAGGERPSGDYTGPYEVTPSESTQRLSTANKTLEQNVIVNPVPDNYARMRWQGSVLIIY